MTTTIRDTHTTLEQFLSDWTRQAFLDIFGPLPAATKLGVTATATPEHGDYQCNQAMTLAKALQTRPRDIATRFVETAKTPPLIERLDVAGPGFINYHLDRRVMARTLGVRTIDGTVPLPDVGRDRTVILDYSGPNVAKPMHVGHIRSTVIGNALHRMYKALGYRVVADNHLGDWGTQFGILIMGYRHFLNPDALREQPIAELERLYVLSHAESRKNPDWLDQARAELVKLQAGDPNNTELWRNFVDLSRREFDRIYQRLNVTFDVVRGESYYRNRTADIVDQLIARGIARESEGAIVAFLDAEKLPPCIVRKRDGGMNYAASDLAAVADRVDEFHPERIVYVTDERQQLHFKQIAAICRRLELPVTLEHVWFGLMRLPGRTFSTREGNVIPLETLLDEAETRAMTMISSTDMAASEKRETARIIGIGAVKYADLSQNPRSLVTFTMDKALSLEGNSGPYLQYAHARIRSLLRKYHDQFPQTDYLQATPAANEASEKDLILRLSRFPETVVHAIDAYKPSALAEYLYELAGAYNALYQTVPFLKAPDGIRESRIRLCACVSDTLRKGLDLLGIEAPERM